MTIIILRFHRSTYLYSKKILVDYVEGSDTSQNPVQDLDFSARFPISRISF